MDSLSKSQFARELGVSTALVCQFVQKGLPTLPDGRIDADVAFDWFHDHVRPWLGGWEITETGQRRRIDSTTTRVGLNFRVAENQKLDLRDDS
jgi:hypothetical protein